MTDSNAKIANNALTLALFRHGSLSAFDMRAIEQGLDALGLRTGLYRTWMEVRILETYHNVEFTQHNRYDIHVLVMKTLIRALHEIEPQALIEFCGMAGGQPTNLHPEAQALLIRASSVQETYRDVCAETTTDKGWLMKMLQWLGVHRG